MSKVTPKHYAVALYDVLQDAEEKSRSSIVRRFLQQLYQAGKLRLLPAITTAFEQLHHARMHTTPVHVSTTQALPADTIQQELIRLFPQEKIVVTTSVNPAVVGGMLVETANQRWNISLAGQLEALANSLKK